MKSLMKSWKFHYRYSEDGSEIYADDEDLYEDIAKMEMDEGLDGGDKINENNQSDKSQRAYYPM